MLCFPEKNMWNIAQVNIARIKAATMEDPMMKEFVDKLEEVNQMAEQSPGFVWRLKGDGGDATAIRYNDDSRIFINMSVWKDTDSLEKFVYKSDHRSILMRRKEWFEKLKEFAVGLWYVPKYSFPSVEDARFRLKYLNENGASPLCFTFAKRFLAEDYVKFLQNPELSLSQ
jgi:hypothetical protein